MAAGSRKLFVAHAVLALVLLVAGGTLLVLDSYVLTTKPNEELTRSEKHQNAVTLAQYCFTGAECEEAAPRKFRLNITINKEDITYTAGISYDSQVGDHVDTGIALMIPAAAKWRVDKDCHGVETRTGSDVGWRYEDSSRSSDARQIFAPSIAACGSDFAFSWTLPRRDLITGVSERATYSRIISPTFTSWEEEWKIKKTVAADVFVYLSDDDYVRNENTFPAFHENVNPFDSRWNSLSIKWAYTSLTVGYSHKVLRTVEDLNQSVIFLAAGILIGSVNWRRVIQHNPPRPEKRREGAPETVSR